MDDTQRGFYGVKFENAFLRQKGKAFESFFARVMAHGFTGDFEPVRPYGSRGDLKCDGFRASDGTVFQCYAPDALKLAGLLAKIDEDFTGARAHWGARMKRWEFVHNDARGLPAEAVRKLEDLRVAYPETTIAVFGEAEMRAVVMRLALHQLEDLFGANRMKPAGPNAGVPRASKQLFGREVEQTNLVKELRSGRSVMITGTGGVGKTELLLHSIRHAGTERPVIWIDVGSYRTSSDILSALRTALDGGEIVSSKGDIPARLDALAACIVFDGVEQAAIGDFDDFQDALIDIYSKTSNTQIAVTSQVVLHGFNAQFRITLQPLDLASSRQLFESFNPVSNGDEAIDMLNFCDGHALTIRLAAALAEHYGGTGPALEVIQSKGAAFVRLPGRSRHNSNTSLELCLKTAFNNLSKGARGLLYALSESPAGLVSDFINNDFLDLGEPLEGLSELRRWHLIDLVVTNDNPSRTIILSPIRAFAIQAGQNTDNCLYNTAVGKLAHAFSMMIAVFELHYNSPDSTPYVVKRYEQELPNLLSIINLANNNRSDKKLGLIAVSIASSMMRYFFIRGLVEQGARVMRDAAQLAVEIGQDERASGLIIQLICLADRARDAALTTEGLALAAKLETQCHDLSVKGDIALGRAIVAKQNADFTTAEELARDALKSYRYHFRKVASLRMDVIGDEENSHEIDAVHNDISHALGLLGFVLLSQHRYEEAGKAYRHSLQHERGASVAVNRGQTLHQIGNCESHLGNHREAAKLYIKAANIFGFVGMESYLSNSVGELGYALIEMDSYWRLEGVNDSLVALSLKDLDKEIRIVFSPGKLIDHDLAVGVIRKTFGSVAAISLSGFGISLLNFSRDTWVNILNPLYKSMTLGERPVDELFPLTMMELALHLAFYAAQGEQAFSAKEGIPREVIDEMLKRVCASDNWERNVMRVGDWLSALLTHRWNLKGAERERLRQFSQNYDNDVEDTLEIES